MSFTTTQKSLFETSNYLKIFQVRQLLDNFFKIFTFIWHLDHFYGITSLNGKYTCVLWTLMLLLKATCSSKYLHKTVSQKILNNLY